MRVRSALGSDIETAFRKSTRDNQGPNIYEARLLGVMLDAVPYLSAGQRQLLSFARALAHGADVLVLDEATSAIDSETEALVQEGIHVLLEGKTALVIAHRLSTIQDADCIYVLHKGQLVESGTHEELLARAGVYERLYRLQYADPLPPVAAAGV